MTRRGFDAARCIVVKVGSSLLQSGPSVIDAIADDIASLAGQGKRIVLVSSGAVALGRPRLGLGSGSLTLEQKQAAAAAGQPVLVGEWERTFARHGRATAQALLTLDVTESRRHWLNARATLHTLLDLGAIPVVNENDTIATDEIRYGDNDRLAARVAQLVGADLLVLLSDIEGLFDRDPRCHPEARLVPEVHRIDASIHAMAGDANKLTGVGTGGMRSKILAAEIAAASGCATIIGSGSARTPILRLRQTGCGSWFHPTGSAVSARAAWIAGAHSPNGEIRIDAGAASALQAGKSLLPVGAIAVDGHFERGDAVRIIGPDGTAIARGVSGYDASDARRICGCKTAEIEALLGYRRASALVHADDIVLSSPGANGGCNV
ncbi:glutamate 5-kinase [Maricaulis salignorans]|uniref:Glutamate 5-kinase n=1 Tax=Maricaulis salignorans TaxID=144026 RepID=A0A1G9LMB7_9PROT|nr:glutamate 5-kinase [Maricaulis salignorans]SDL63102.1 glutamate 5-kinase [Maricaulis salignorans]